MLNLPASFDNPESIRDIVEAAPNGVVMVDANGSIVLVNQELERMFGHPRVKLIGRPIEVLIPERFQQGHVHMRAGYLAKPERRPMGAGRELFARRADGSEFPVEIGLKGIHGPSGVMAIASVVDVTARHEAELTARNIVAAAPYGLLIVEPKGTIVLANPQITRIFGYTPEELIGTPIERLVPDRYRSSHIVQRSGFARAPSLRAMGANRDLTGLHKDGTEFPLEIGLSPVPWKGGTASLAAVIDISVRKRLELELREANAHLEEFTYVASHDLKSPLRGINDLVEWVSDDLKDASPDVRRNLERIQTRVTRMERIIEDLLSYAQARNATAELTLVDPRELAHAIVELEAPPSGFVVEIQAAALPFRAARIPLETVLRNLISNAIKHHDRGTGHITIKATEDDAYCHIAVSDDGPGVPPQAQERIFKLFQTVSSSERRGSGIGLALSKRLVESHGGKIRLVSEGRGSTFHVWWPRFEWRSADE